MTESYVVVDIETTGLNPARDRILEIGAVKVNNNEVTDTFSTFVNARVQISSLITNLTGINNSMIVDAPEPGEAIKEFIDFCEDYILMGHNIMFDYSFLKRCAVNHQHTFDRKGIDTLKIARRTLPDLEKRSLEFLCSHYGIEQEEKHRAYYDAMVTKLLYDRLKEQFGERYDYMFDPYELIYQVKKQSPLTKFQRVYLLDLIKYHRIELGTDIDSLTKSEASRMIDNILSEHGRIARR